VRCAACWVLRVISWVAAPCSSTAAAITVDLVDFADNTADRLDRVDGLGGDLLDVGDLFGNIVGRLRGLAGQGFNLGGHHRETATGLAGSGGLDGRVQRQQVGLRRDVVDQANHFADPVGGFRPTHRGQEAISSSHP
jgi:hypothetical protein